MPYEGEFAQYQPLRRIAESEQVQKLLKRAKTNIPVNTGPSIVPQQAPDDGSHPPDLLVAIDGSMAEVPVKNGYPGAKVGYCTVASVLLNLRLIDTLDVDRPVNPVEFRATEEASTIDAALPGSNVVTRDHLSARHSLRESIFDVFHDVVVDEDDKISLLDTFEELLRLKPQGNGQICPYGQEGCDERVILGAGQRECGCSHRRRLYSTDALRIHEGFQDFGSNGEAYGELMQVWERVLLVHLLRCLERRGWLADASRMAFVLDGPLAVFGHPAWLSASISAELKRLNAASRAGGGEEFLILGIEKSGAFVAHFSDIDVMEDPGKRLFDPRTYVLLTDSYIKSRVIYSNSPKRYGLDTYFGRKFFYKTASGAQIVASIPFLTDTQDTLDTADPSLHTRFGSACALLDRVASSRYSNSVSPLISAHGHAAIPLHIGSKVLQQLAKALMQTSEK
jgi:hypothetical protein